VKRFLVEASAWFAVGIIGGTLLVELRAGLGGDTSALAVAFLVAASAGLVVLIAWLTVAVRRSPPAYTPHGGQQ